MRATCRQLKLYLLLYGRREKWLLCGWGRGCFDLEFGSGGWLVTRLCLRPQGQDSNRHDGGQRKETGAGGPVWEHEANESEG